MRSSPRRGACSVSVPEGAEDDAKTLGIPGKYRARTTRVRPGSVINEAVRLRDALRFARRTRRRRMPSRQPTDGGHPLVRTTRVRLYRSSVRSQNPSTSSRRRRRRREVQKAGAKGVCAKKEKTNTGLDARAMEAATSRARSLIDHASGDAPASRGGHQGSTRSSGCRAVFGTGPSFHEQQQRKELGRTSPLVALTVA